MKPVLQVNDLCVAFASRGETVTAVDRVSFDLNSGEILALVGESGSGKSVTALSVLGLVPQPPGNISGSVTFEGRDLLALSPDAMRDIRGNDIAMIFQEPMTSLNPVMTLGQQIEESLKAHTTLDSVQRRQRILELFEQVELPAQKIDDYPHQLSGGMRQRVMIAIALACNPKILIADEPTTALDVLIQAQILNLLQRIQRETGMAVLFITHDLGVVAQIADRVMVMYSGKIVEAGPARQVFQAARHPYTHGLLHCIPRSRAVGQPRERLQEITGNVPAPGEPVQGCAFFSRCSQGDEQCQTQMPDLEQQRPDHHARCWHPVTGS